MAARDPLRCDSCGSFADWQELAPGEEGPCPDCAEPMWVPLDPPPHPIPWEDRRLGVLRRWWRTVDQASYHPASFFAEIPYEGGHKAPIRFIVFFYLQFFLFGAVAVPVFSWFKGEPLISWWLAFLVLLGMPFAIGVMAVWIYISSAAVHGCVKALGGKGSFEATFRVMAYTYPIYMYRFIPWVGRYLYPVWSVICQTIGLAAAHRISKKRAFFGALVGVGLLFGIVVAAGFLFALFWVAGPDESYEVIGAPE